MDSGVASARGSACSMKWTAAELLDTTRGRTGGGERGYGVGTTAVASAMAGGREGEELESADSVADFDEDSGDAVWVALER